MSASDKVNKVVWVNCGGRCAMCREELCLPGASSLLFHLVGDVAHIVAEEEGGPRGQSPTTLEERNSEPNLLLLCKRHHKMVDDDPATYTVALLTKVKSDHQSWVKSSLSSYPIWDTKLFQLDYINVPRLAILASIQGTDIDLSQFGDIDALHELGFELHGLMAAFKKLLQSVQLKAVPLERAVQSADPVGMVVSFNHVFRTKNIALPAPGESFQTLFNGGLKTDPHIYCKIGKTKVVERIDRRWVTSTTAFVRFRSSGGRNRFGGLGFVNGVESQTNAMNITPYVIGLPSNPVMEAFYGALDGSNAVSP